MPIMSPKQTKIIIVIIIIIIIIYIIHTKIHTKNKRSITVLGMQLKRDAHAV